MTNSSCILSYNMYIVFIPAHQVRFAKRFRCVGGERFLRCLVNPTRPPGRFSRHGTAGRLEDTQTSGNASLKARSPARRAL